MIIEDFPRPAVRMESLDGPALASLVSSISEIVCGARFDAIEAETRGQSVCGRMVSLPLSGPRDIRVVLSCDGSGARALSAAMRKCPAEGLTRAMMDDSIGEFLNMVAGQVQRAFHIDQPLGLPAPTTLAELTATPGLGFHDSILLSSRGMGELKLWIFEVIPQATAAEPPAGLKPGGRGGIRSFFRKL